MNSLDDIIFIKPTLDLGFRLKMHNRISFRIIHNYSFSYPISTKFSGPSSHQTYLILYSINSIFIENIFDEINYFILNEFLNRDREAN